MSTYVIGLAEPEHLAALAGVEQAAASLFPPDILPPDVRTQVVPEAVLTAAQAEKRLWVALDGHSYPVGFALAQPTGETALLAEVDVHPDHGRQGLGRALVGAVIDWAQVEGFSALTLTTFAHLPWNAPFYERLGFRRLSEPEIPLALARVLEAEERDGLRDRIAMLLHL